jgi:hypothetical protein
VFELINVGFIIARFSAAPWLCPELEKHRAVDADELSTSHSGQFISEKSARCPLYMTPSGGRKNFVSDGNWTPFFQSLHSYFTAWTSRLFYLKLNYVTPYSRIFLE